MNLKKFIPKNLFDFLRRLSHGNYFYFFNLLKIKPNKIVVSNYHGKGFGDNAKYICLELLKIDEKLDIVWLTSEKMPIGFRKVKYGSFKSLYEMATAKIWIDNCRKDFYPPKKKNQFYLQTWHSPMRLKKIEKDAIQYLSDSYIKKAKDDSKMCDLMISGSNFSYKIYSESFWYDGKISKIGTPRCDILMDRDRKKVIKNKVSKSLNVSEEKKYVLYAPTFRNTGEVEVYSFDYLRIVNQLELKFGGDWILLLRLHPNVSNLSKKIKYSEKVVNASMYDDMQELLLSSDVLITDYSSSMFDKLISEDICFLLAKDLDDYKNTEREMYFSFEELPFKISQTEEELINQINNFSSKIYLEDIRKFKSEINMYEKGNASIKLAEELLDVMGRTK